MNRELSPEAVQLGALVRERIQDAGGVDLLRRAVADPSVRASIGELFEELGVWEIDPGDGPLEFEAAAEVCRVAGSFAVPYPVVERLGSGSVDRMTVLIAEQEPRIVSHLDLGFDCSAVTLQGNRVSVDVSILPPALATPLAPFACEVTGARVTDERDPDLAARLITLQSWWLLGLLQTVLADTLRYAQEREQFGRSLVKFQAVAFRLADMSLEIEGLIELARYTVWALGQNGGSEDARLEALGLRVAAQRAADLVLRGGHQLHGAMGFTDEVNLSWLSKASQAVRRLPEDSGRTLGVLTELAERRGYPALG